MHEFSFKTTYSLSECQAHLGDADLGYKHLGFQVRPSISLDNDTATFKIALNVYTLHVEGTLKEDESEGTLVSGNVRVRWLSFDRLVLMIVPLLMSIYYSGNAYIRTDNFLYILGYALCEIKKLNQHPIEKFVHQCQSAYARYV